MTVFRVKHNNAPKPLSGKMKCDVELSAKMNEYPLARDNLNKYNTTVIVGKQGSGKTSLMLLLLHRVYKKVFNHIYVFMPASSRASIPHAPFDGLPDDQVFEELNAENISEVYAKLKEDAAAGERSLLIFDDVQNALKDNAVLHKLKKIVANQRHLHCVSLILCQNFYALDRSLRELINNLVFFHVDKSQGEKIFRQSLELSPEEYEWVTNHVFDEEHNWCFVNLNSRRLYRLWDEIVIER